VYTSPSQSLLLDAVDNWDDVQVIVNGKKKPVVAGTIELEPGQNVVEIRVEDEQGNYYTTTYAVQLSVPLPQVTDLTPDTTEPIFTINVPLKTNAQPLTVTMTVTNENSVTGSLFIDGSSRSTNLIYLGNNRYAFKENLGLSTGTHTVRVLLKDAAGNQKESTDVSIDVNTVAPDFASATIEFSPIAVKNLSGVLTTREQDLTFGGLRPANVNVYLIGEDKKYYDPALTQVGYDFEDIPLVGQTFTEQLNNLRLVLEDEYGNKAERQISLLKDLRPPQLVRLLFQRKILGVTSIN
ncbi:MAG TPA: hypothetical protein VKE88_00485, partial [Candidatus Nanoarchaeia archaeon]|nr:hypothetical protein [Candidatus Nanoarchaeia archaeon]